MEDSSVCPFGFFQYRRIGHASNAAMKATAAATPNVARHPHWTKAKDSQASRNGGRRFWNSISSGLVTALWNSLFAIEDQRIGQIRTVVIGAETIVA